MLAAHRMDPMPPAASFSGSLVSRRSSVYRLGGLWIAGKNTRAARLQ